MFTPHTSRFQKFIVLAVAFISTVLSAANSDFEGQREIEDVLAQIEKVTSRAERMEAASANFLGRPFLDGNLGEGRGDEYDSDPLSRTDVFDCTTFVETNLAIAFSTDWTSFKKHMNDIRYSDGKPSYTSRNHFPEFDWIPNNEAKGYFRDITKAVGGTLTKRAKTTIKKAPWYAGFVERQLKTNPPKEKVTALEALRKKTEAIKHAPAELDYISFVDLLGFTPDEMKDRKADETAIRTKFPGDTAKINSELAQYRADFLADHSKNIREDIFKKIPSGAIVNYVHPDRPLEKFIGTNMLVTHQGLLVWKKGILYARHASTDEKKVTDIPLVEYINQFANPGALHPQGINVLELK